MYRAIYKGMCPNCGKEIDDSRLNAKNPCKSCVEKKLQCEDYHELLEKIEEYLKENNNLYGWKEIYELHRDLKDIENLFEKATNSKFWNIQKTWFIRLIKGESFPIIAPTGVGKSIFGIFASLYYALKNKKSYIIVPTTSLVLQTVEKIKKFMEKTQIKVNLAFYHGKLKEKEKMKNKIENDDFDILVTTSQYLAINFDILKNKKFDFIFIDDVDAFLKSSRNIDRSLILLGFSEEIIEKGWKLIKLKERGPKRNSEQIKKIENKIKEFKEKNKIGNLVVASATIKVKNKRIKIYRELLNFEITGEVPTIRNMVDSYIKTDEKIEKHLVKLLNILGNGGIIFVPTDQGIEKAKKIENYLKNNGFKVKLVSSADKTGIKEFKEGKIDYLVGVATYYGVLVRGLDIPERVRYTIFTGVPKHRFVINLDSPRLYSIIILLRVLIDVLKGNYKRKAESLYTKLQKIPKYKIKEIEKKLENGHADSRITKIYDDSVKFVRKIFKKEEIRKKIFSNEFLSMEIQNNKLCIKFPDLRTYLQASGRASRLFAGGITHGLSVVIIDDEKVFEGLKRQYKWQFQKHEFKAFEKLKLKKILNKIDEDRKKVKAIKKHGKFEIKNIVKSALFIVESPNKARTIANMFGNIGKRRIGRLTVYETNIGNRILMIVATGGHIFDLVNDEGFHGIKIENGHFIPIYDTIKRCRECGNQFVNNNGSTCPKCKSNDIIDTFENILVMRELAQEVDEVLIGTDPDVEGEKIAWDVMNVLSPYTSNLKRVEFHEVTRSAILKAIKEASKINIKRVEAQIVRRIEDRWIGFELSQKLWKEFDNTYLSAGRVQTPVLGWIIKRYNDFRKSETYFTKLTLENRMEIILEGKKEADYLEVKKVNKEEKDINPNPPYTTDTLLTDASRILGFPTTKTMRLAQDLFEMGFVTYIRTDATYVSDVGNIIARDYIKNEIGEKYFKARKWGKEGAHECIRPTRPIDSEKIIQLIRNNVIRTTKKLTSDHLRLYNLIFKRFMASQMTPVNLHYQKIVLGIDDEEIEIEGYTDIIDPGWTKIVRLPMKKLPEVKEGQKIKIKEIKTWKAPKISLFTEGDVIEKMKKSGIGRPSTYSKIVNTLLDRRYVIKTKLKKKLLPTKLGVNVYNYLIHTYEKLVSEERTRELEKVMDEIEEGSRNYQEVLNSIYEEIKQFV